MRSGAQGAGTVNSGPSTLPTQKAKTAGMGGKSRPQTQTFRTEAGGSFYLIGQQEKHNTDPAPSSCPPLPWLGKVCQASPDTLGGFSLFPLSSSKKSPIPSDTGQSQLLDTLGPSED